MDIDLDDLDLKARKATPGPWRFGDWSAEFGTRENPERRLRLEHNPTHPGPEPYVRQRGDGARSVLVLEEPPCDENAAFIAACSPDVIIALVDRCRKAEVIVDAATKWSIAKCAGAPECSAYEEDHGDKCPVTVTTQALYAALAGGG